MLALAVLIYLWASSARADPFAAEALFQEGRRLLDTGDFEAAAEKFLQSEAEDPASGTLMNVALCRERQGRLATAWAYYASAAALARRDGRPDRVAAAEQKLVDLAPRVPHLIIRVERTLPAMEASWGNVRLGPDAFGAALPIDPGTYEVRVSAPDFQSHTTTIVALEGKTVALDVPGLRPIQAKPLPDAAPRLEPAPAGRVSPSAPPRTAMWAAAGTAALAAGATAYFGVRSLNAYAEAERACPSHHGCSTVALDRRHDAEISAWAANISGAIAAIGAGFSVWFSTRPAHHPSPSGASLRLAPIQAGAMLALTAPL